MSNVKKILIGTPVHKAKDYSMERWFAAVCALDYPFDLLLVDNSENLTYVKKLEAYCHKFHILNYKIVHIDVLNNSPLEKRLAEAREIIRKEVLHSGYDFWYSLECDVIVPPDALTRLIHLIKRYWMISHGYPSRTNPDEVSKEFGTALIRRKALEKLDFRNQYGFIDPKATQVFQGNDSWFKTRILTAGGTYLNVFGQIKPIYHLVE